MKANTKRIILAGALAVCFGNAGVVFACKEKCKEIKKKFGAWIGDYNSNDFVLGGDASYYETLRMQDAYGEINELCELYSISNDKYEKELIKETVGEYLVLHMEKVSALKEKGYVNYLYPYRKHNTKPSNLLYKSGLYQLNLLLQSNLAAKARKRKQRGKV